jgi:hypothetical protein
MTAAHVDDSFEAREVVCSEYRRQSLRRSRRHRGAPRHGSTGRQTRRARSAQSAQGGPVARYLAGRGITIAPPPSLRWASRCWHAKARGSLPAMVARIDDIEGRLIGVHRTWLDRDAAGQWDRRDRASLGPIGGRAVRLAEPDKTLLICGFR